MKLIANRPSLMLQSQMATTKSDFPPKEHVSLVHDFFIAWGGAEVVADALAQAFPNHTLYASVDLPETRHFPLDKENVKTTFLQKLPFLRSKLLEIYKFLLPMAFENIHFDQNTSLIISDTASFAKFVIPPVGVKHLSYIHTPPRFLWGLPPSKKVRSLQLLRFLWNLTIGSTFRLADYLHAQRVHGLVANSQEVAKRIRKYYRREPVAIINPPVYVKKFATMVETKRVQQQESFLAFGRIERYKNFDTLVKIWPKGYKLTIAGKGSQAEEIKRLIKNNDDITFINRYIPDEEKPELFASHKAFLYPNVEDFGIMMVEALSVGTPVITFREGGGGEIVTHQQNGYLMEELTTPSLKSALDWALAFQKSTPQRNTFFKDMLKYDIDAFITKIRALANEYRRNDI